MSALPELLSAAAAAAWGIPYRRLLTLHDRTELAMERFLVDSAVERARDIEEGKAIAIGNAVGKVIGG